MPLQVRGFMEALRAHNAQVRKQQVAFLQWHRRHQPVAAAPAWAPPTAAAPTHNANWTGAADEEIVPWGLHALRFVATFAVVFAAVTEAQNYVYLERLVMLNTPLRPDAAGSGPTAKSVPIESAGSTAAAPGPASSASVAGIAPGRKKATPADDRS